MKTVFNLSSGAGIAGVAVVRVSGPDANLCIEHMCKKPVEPNKAQLRSIYDPGTDEKLDRECT